MAEQEGRPTFDLSAFSSFTSPAAGQADPMSCEMTETVENDSKKFRVQKGDLSNPKTELLMTRQDGGELVDLTRYGPPVALAKLNQTAPLTVIAVVENSIDNIRAQVDTETQMQRRQEQTKRQYVQEKQKHRAKDKTLEVIDKGKGVEGVQIGPASSSISSIASDQTETASFYTPSEGRSPSVDAQSEAGTNGPTTEDQIPFFAPMPRLKASSTSAIPRRRDLVKAMFRRMSDIDARRHVLHRSKGPLQFKARFKYAKQIWQGEVQAGFVNLTYSSSLLQKRVFSQYSFHRLFKPFASP